MSMFCSLSICVGWVVLCRLWVFLNIYIIKFMGEIYILRVKFWGQGWDRFITGILLHYRIYIHKYNTHASCI